MEIKLCSGEDEADSGCVFLNPDNRELANIAACVLGIYCSSEIAACTLRFDFGETVARPLVTRDTVATDTPASLAISRTVGAIHLPQSFANCQPVQSETFCRYQSLLNIDE